MAFDLGASNGRAILGQFDGEKITMRELHRFENNYIDAIRANIINEEEHIKSLNKLLANKPFGTDGDIYRFIVTKSKDKAFGDYYDIFKGNENFVQTDLFGDNLPLQHIRHPESPVRRFLHRSQRPWSAHRKSLPLYI